MFRHSLMQNNFTKTDISSVINFLKRNNILTQSKKVSEFEKKWSRWLGVKYSIFVNSGSSANLISINILKILKKPGGEVIVPALTWSSDISSLLHCGFKPVFVDINLNTLSASTDQILRKITRNTKAVFLTHAQGFSGITNKLIKFLKKKKIMLIEDVCESHGAKFGKKKLGVFGEISNFSFYYAHHMSTIEGGMISTNNKKIYHLAKMLRSHGLVREIKNKKIEKSIIKKNQSLSPQFIFLYPGYNMRNTEIAAVLGLSQLTRLDSNNKKRTVNFKLFLKHIDGDYFFKNFNIEGSSNYAFPVILKQKSIRLRNYLEKLMQKNNIEFRRGNAGGGNQLRQPYLKKIVKWKIKDFQNVELVHSCGYYVGNYPDLKKNKIIKICNILNKIKKINEN